MWDRRQTLGGAAALLASGIGRTASADTPTLGQNSEILTIEVDLKTTDGALEHIWSRCGGSDRAAITLREQWRNDLTRAHTEMGLERVRFHGIFNDELGVYAPSILSAKKAPNWQNVDQVYDGLLARGVRPFVELSFMPKYLASGKQAFGFYGGNITPPVSFEAWGDFIKAFVTHLVDRYGSDEIRQWQFEVWNEPNLVFFWSSDQATYFELYKHTVQAIKSVDPRIEVGGPSTALTAWIPEFLAYCQQNQLPVDFVSTHIYAGDDQTSIFGKKDAYPQNDFIPAAMAKVRKDIDATAYAGTQLWLSEWSSDSPAMIAHVVKGCLPYCYAMSQWSFTNVFEEIGVPNFVLKEGDNGWGIIALGGIPKPAFNTYKLMHQLGTTRLKASDGPVLATRTDANRSAIAVWNLVDVQQPSGIPGASSVRKVIGEPKQMRLVLKGARPGQRVQVSYVDQERGSPFPLWRKLGSPQYPTPDQIKAIRASAEIQPPERRTLDKSGALVLSLPPEGVALIEIG